MGRFKFYVVQKGHKPGIYDNWFDASEQINGYSGFLVKGFKKFKDAEDWWNDPKRQREREDRRRADLEHQQFLEHKRRQNCTPNLSKAEVDTALETDIVAIMRMIQNMGLGNSDAIIITRFPAGYDLQTRRSLQSSSLTSSPGLSSPGLSSTGPSPIKSSSPS
ncbi:hypothetical protein IL306_000778 [Fusarium sp. DS 682]|nr:hypothetical protein IL306_000778 [Fusarium sp. DS 682]